MDASLTPVVAGDSGILRNLLQCGAYERVYSLGATLESLAQCVLAVPEAMDDFVERFGASAVGALTAAVAPHPRRGLFQAPVVEELETVIALNRHSIRVGSARIACRAALVLEALRFPNVHLDSSTLGRVPLPASVYIAYPDRGAVLSALHLMDEPTLDEVVPHVLATDQAVEPDTFLKLIQNPQCTHLLRWLGRLRIVPNSRHREMASILTHCGIADYWPTNTIVRAAPPSAPETPLEVLQAAAKAHLDGTLTMDEVLARIESAMAASEDSRRFFRETSSEVVYLATLAQPRYAALRQRRGVFWPRLSVADVQFLTRFEVWYSRVFGTKFPWQSASHVMLLVPFADLPRFVRNAAQWLEFATSVMAAFSGAMWTDRQPTLSPAVSGEAVTCCMLHLLDDGAHVAEDDAWRKSVFQLLKWATNQSRNEDVLLEPSVIAWMLEWYVLNVPARAGDPSATAAALELVMKMERADVGPAVFAATVHPGAALQPTDADWRVVVARWWGRHDWWRSALVPQHFLVLATRIVTWCSADDIRDFIRDHPAWCDVCLFLCVHQVVPVLLELGASPRHRMIMPVVQPPLPGAVAATVAMLGAPRWASDVSVDAQAHLDAYVAAHRQALPSALPVQCTVCAEVAAVLARHGVAVDADAGARRLAAATVAAAKAVDLAAALAAAAAVVQAAPPPAPVAAVVQAAPPPAPVARGLADWSVDEVCDHFASFGATAAHLDTLRSEHVNGKALLLLSSAQLRDDLKLPLGLRVQHEAWLTCQ